MQCICGKELAGRQKYCSAACRMQASRDRSVTDDPQSVTESVTNPLQSVTSVTEMPVKPVTVTVAGQTLELGKPYSTDRDCRWSLNYDLSEEGFKRRNLNWMDKSKASKAATMEAGRRMHIAHVAKVASNTASRRAIVQACAV